jgi:NADH-quinone oxidoreductase subunit J
MIEITPLHIVFGVSTLFVLGGGLGVVTGRNLVHAALWLVLSFFGVASLFVLLEASFLAAVQVVVYIGAIAVLITITIMVTQRVMGAREALVSQWPLALIVAALLFATLGFVAITNFADVTIAEDVSAESVARLGAALVSPSGFLLPFEVASVLLLAAMIGSIVVARD